MFKKRLSVAACIVICAIFCAVTFVGTHSALTVKYKQDLNSQKAVASEEEAKLRDIFSIIETGYLRDFDKSVLWERVYAALVEGLSDKYSAYMTADEYSEYTSGDNGNFVGIGVYCAYDSQEGGLYISTVFPDSPAEKAGMKQGDVITAVNGVSFTDENNASLADSISGDEGTEVLLTVKSSGRISRRVLTRQKVSSNNVLYERFDRVAYIKIVSFSDMTVSEEFGAAIKKAKQDGCKSFLFDVRNNPGGFLDEICAVLDILLPEGVIINIVDKNGNTSQKTSDASCIDAPMAVLCNENTASAAELFTKALMDYNMAQSVGETTLGKGTVQITKILPDGSAVRISSYYYNPPCNVSYDGVGIEPDHKVLLPDEKKMIFHKLKKEEDDQFLFALSLLKD